MAGMLGMLGITIATEIWKRMVAVAAATAVMNNAKHRMNLIHGHQSTG